MAFSSNPLSLSVPEPAFESWLRDSGYLEILDHRTTQLHNLSSSPPTTTPPPSATTPTTATTTTLRRTPTTTITSIAYGLTMSFLASFATIFSLLTLNPFSRLTSADFSSPNSPSWTSGFLGSFDSYSLPSSTTQARMRVHENVKRFARNYATLLILFFACSLYQMPLALAGLLSCLAMWEVFRFCDNRWALDRFSAARQILIRVAQCAVGVILFWSNVQMAVFCTLGVGYIVMILHASFRKLTPAKQLTKGRGR